METIKWDGKKFAMKTPLIRSNFHNETNYQSVTASCFGAKEAQCFFNPNNSWNNGSYPVPTNDYNIAFNKALTKVDDQLAVISNLFETMYERKQAYAMIGTAGKEILNFVKNWRKPKYWRSLKTGVKNPTTLPSAWLAYNFGLKPLIGSIDDAMHLLGADFPVHTVVGTSGISGSFKGGNPGNSNFYYRVNGSYNLIVSIRARVLPNLNPNKALSNVVGLTTPFSTAWSVIPWGWAVDYFVNVSDLLSNFEVKHPGVTVQQMWCTDYIRASANQHYYNGYPTPPIEWSAQSNVVRTLRKPTAGNYKLQFSLPLFGSNKFANLFSAIALTMSGKKNR